MRLPLAGEFFETNPKMVLINVDQWHIADIVLDGWLFEKKMNHSSVYQVPKNVFIRQDMKMSSF